MGKSAPKPPDYEAAAQAQAQSSREVTEQQTWANRPDQVTPFGTQSWSNAPQWDPSTQQWLNRWTQTTELNPLSQEALDSQLAVTRDRSQLASSLTGRMQDEYSRPMNWRGFTPLAGTPTVPSYGQDMSDFGSAPTVPGYDASSLPSRGSAPTPFSMGGLPQRGEALTPGDLGALPDRGQGPSANQYSPEAIQRGVQTEDLQRNLSNEGLTNIDPSQRYYQNAGNAIYNQWAERALPEQQFQEERLRTQLLNQGLNLGDAAYERELNNLRMQQGDQQRQAAYQATIGAGQEASRMFGMDTSARGQMFGERQAMGDFYNQAANQAFGQNLQAGGFANQASQQALQQQLGIGSQQFGEGMQLAGLSDAQRQAALGEQAQRFGQQAQASSLMDAQRQAALGEFGQQFEQQLGAGQFSDAQRQAALGEMLGIGNQQFAQGLQSANFANALRQQQLGEQLSIGDQQFSQQQAAANYQNQLRQQQIAEAMQQRGFTLNEINAMLTGQQVGMPNMPSFQNAGRAEGLQALTAANMQHQANLDSFNASQAATQGMMSGIGSMGSAFMMSDRRLKRNVKRIGTVKGVPLYSYEYIWGEKGVGVMADEVTHIPGAVAIHPSGFAMVNYGVIYG